MIEYPPEIQILILIAIIALCIRPHKRRSGYNPPPKNPPDMSKIKLSPPVPTHGNINHG